MRITLDKDHNHALDILTTYFNLKQSGKPVELRRSSSGRGFHMIVRGLNIPYEGSLAARAYLGECPTRLRFDSEKNAKPKSLLWSEKIIDGKLFKVQPLVEADLLNLPACSRPPQAIFKKRIRRD